MDRALQGEKFMWGKDPAEIENPVAVKNILVLNIRNERAIDRSIPNF